MTANYMLRFNKFAKPYNQWYLPSTMLRDTKMTTQLKDKLPYTAQLNIHCEQWVKAAPNQPPTQASDTNTNHHIQVP